MAILHPASGKDINPSEHWLMGSTRSYPKRYIILMSVISILAFVGESTITVSTFGSGIIAVPLVILVVSLPMVYLLSKDITSIRQRGVDWGFTRWLIYLVAIPLPSYIITPIYLVLRRSKTSS